MQLSPDGPYTSIGTQRGDPEDHEPIDRKQMARLSSQMSRSHHPVEKAMAPVPVRDARQSFPPFDGVFSPFKHGSIRHGSTARTADRAVLVELRRFLAGVHAQWDVPDVHSPISTGPRRSAFKIRLRGAVSGPGRNGPTLTSGGARTPFTAGQVTPWHCAHRSPMWLDKSTTVPLSLFITEWNMLLGSIIPGRNP